MELYIQSTATASEEAVKNIYFRGHFRTSHTTITVQHHMHGT